MGDPGARPLVGVLLRDRTADANRPDTRDYFEIGDREDLSYEEKLAEYRKLADAYFQIDEYDEFCAKKLPHLDEALVEWVEGPDFDRVLVVRSSPPSRSTSRTFRRPLPRPARGVGTRPARVSCSVLERLPRRHVERRELERE